MFKHQRLFNYKKPGSYSSNLSHAHFFSKSATLSVGAAPPAWPAPVPSSFFATAGLGVSFGFGASTRGFFWGGSPVRIFVPDWRASKTASIPV